MRKVKLTFLILIVFMINMFLSGCSSNATTSVKTKEKIVFDEVLIFEIEDTDNLTGDLYFIDGNEEKIKIDSKVLKSSFQITPIDKKILYVTEDNTLYLKELDTEKEKISSDVYPYTIRFSGDENIIAFEKENSDNSYDLYINEMGQDKEKICSDVFSYNISWSGDKVYYIDMENNLYLKEADKEKEKIASNVNFVNQFEDGKIALYTTKDNDFYYKDITEDDKIKLSSESIKLYTNLYVRNDGKMVAYLEDYDYTKARGELLLYSVGENTHKVASDVVYYYISEDGKYIYYINDEDELFLLDVKKDEKEKIASEVENTLFSSESTSVAYLDKDDNLYFKELNKEKEKISTDVDTWSFGYNKIVILNNDGELFIKKSKEEKVKIASEIVDFSLPGDGCLFYYNEDNELFSMIDDNEPTMLVETLEKNTEIYIRNYLFLTKKLTFEDISGIWKSDYFNEVVVISKEGKISGASYEEEYPELQLTEDNSSNNFISASVFDANHDFSLVDENTLSINYNDYYRITEEQYIKWKENKILDNFLYRNISITGNQVDCYDSYGAEAEYLGFLEYGDEIYVDDIYKDTNGDIWINGSYYDDYYNEFKIWFVYNDELMYLE